VRRSPIQRRGACAVALPGPPGEKPFPGALVSDKIRPGVGLTVADDQSAGRGAVPGAPGRARGVWNDQDRTANAPVDERLAASSLLLDRGDAVLTAPMFVLQGELDGNILPAVQGHFMATYRVAGGAIDDEVSPGAGHRGIVQPGLQTDRAIDMIKAFIARQVRAR
jgi:hypothetical protein